MKNSPQQWQKHLPKLKPDGNKYDRGHAVVIGGGVESTGAARLAATAALRAGAGLITIACPKNAVTVYASQLTAVMLKSIGADFDKFIKDDRKTAFLVGPGSGVTEATRKLVLKLLKLDKNLVIDADAITVFKNKPEELFKAIKQSKGWVVLTPHEGEFDRIFKLPGAKEPRAVKAAKISGAVVLLKGSKTAIASSQGIVITNENAPPTLATAGSGDVLAGIITGLLAQGMPAFEAAAAGAWMHAEAAKLFGYGLISEDLLYLLPRAMDKVFK